MTALTHHPARRRRGATLRRERVRTGRAWFRRLAQPDLLGRMLLLCLLLSATVWVAKRADGLLANPVREVSINGEFRYLQQAALNQVLAPFIRDEYLTVSLYRLRKALEELPWVYSAAVKRRWPDGISIFIEEQQPIAWWGRDMLVNKKGNLFSPAGINVEDTLPLLDGPAGTQAEVMERYIDIGQVLGSRGLSVHSIRLSVRGSWSTGLKGGLELVFGRRHIMGKLRRFLAVYDRVLQPYLPDIRRIDLRYQNGLAVQWLRDGGFSANRSGALRL